MSDLQAAIEGRLATIVQCTNVKPCVMCERQAEIIRTDLAALLEQAQRETWQPIETCPLDGFFLVYEDGAMRTLYRSRGQWQSTAVAVDSFGMSLDPQPLVIERMCGKPTHWKAPQPPVGDAAS